MHDGTIAQGDAWLQTHWDPYVQWAKTHNSLAILTFDEDGGGSNQIYTVFAGAGVIAGQYSEHITHYTVLRTVESFYGLPGIAGAVGLNPITDVFGVVSPPPNMFLSPNTSSAKYNRNSYVPGFAGMW